MGGGTRRRRCASPGMCCTASTHSGRRTCSRRRRGGLQGIGPSLRSRVRARRRAGRSLGMSPGVSAVGCSTYGEGSRRRRQDTFPGHGIGGRFVGRPGSDRPSPHTSPCASGRHEELRPHANQSGRSRSRWPCVATSSSRSRQFRRRRGCGRSPVAGSRLGPRECGELLQLEPAHEFPVAGRFCVGDLLLESLGLRWRPGALVG